MSKRITKASKDYLSVKDFAEKVGKSDQAIYKRIEKNPDFRSYTAVVNGKKMIHKSAIKDVYGIEPDPEDIEKATQPEDNQQLEIINLLKEQLKEKDKQIADLTEALINEQKLHANTATRLALLEDKTVEQPDQEEQQQEETNQGLEHSVNQSNSPQIQLEKEKLEDLPKGLFYSLKRLIKRTGR